MHPIRHSNFTPSLIMRASAELSEADGSQTQAQRVDSLTTRPQARVCLWSLRGSSRTERALRPQLRPVALPFCVSFQLQIARNRRVENILVQTSQAPEQRA
jgi:hypothetical protein